MYSEQKISPRRRTLTLSASGLPEGTWLVLAPTWCEYENAHEPVPISSDVPVKLEVEKGAWFRIGLAGRNPSPEDKTVLVTAENVLVRPE